jgi:hypothetical protein
VDGRFFTSDALVPVPTGAERRTRAAAGGLELRDVAVAAATDGSTPLHDPPLRPRDEAVFLLTAAAEIEHALMVQYLFTAYSVRTGPDAPAGLQAVQDLLVEIAREEMGHLATVQNLLHVVGGPLNLDRDQAPYASDIYPFRFTLEPMSLSSLAKYVTAESPDPLPKTLPMDDVTLVWQLATDAAAANDGVPVRHVGPIYARIGHLLEFDLADGDFRLTVAGRQARDDDWGYQPKDLATEEALIVADFPATTAQGVREAAVAAVRAISEQGEGFDTPAEDHPGESHFERFLGIYKQVSAMDATLVAWPVATDPNTTKADGVAAGGPPELAAAREAALAGGRITASRTLAWAQLFNARYRLLLGQFQHFMRLDQERYSQTGDRTERGLLLRGAFDEMRHLSKIARKLVRMPLRDGSPQHAGPPFELPYSLHLPDGEPQRWRMHLDATLAATDLAAGLRTTDPDDPFLVDLVAQDDAAQTLMAALAEGAPIPAGSIPQGFAKVVTILEEAVRGFDVGKPHSGFWSDVNRETFLVAKPPPVGRPIAVLADGTVDPEPEHSTLVKRLKGPALQMPARRPPVPGPRIDHIRDWISRGAPDDTPADAVGVHHEATPLAEPTAPAGPAPSFATDIRPLFREEPDRSDMLKFGPFDLHVLEDVRAHASGILQRLNDGDMPCDGAWPRERIALFQSWVDAGTPP